MEDKIKALVVKPQMQPEIVSIENKLVEFNEIIGGYMEVLFLDDNVVLVCNEDGIRLNLPINRLVCGNFIYGNFVICEIEDGEYASLSDLNLNKYLSMFELRGVNC